MKECDISVVITYSDPLLHIFRESRPPTVRIYAPGHTNLFTPARKSGGQSADIRSSANTRDVRRRRGDCGKAALHNIATTLDILDMLSCK